MKRHHVLECLAVVMLVFGCSKADPAGQIPEGAPSEAGQPAGQVHGNPPEQVSPGTEIQALTGKDLPAVVRFLTAQGFASADLADASSDTALRVSKASRQDINLDEDDELESLIRIILEGQPDEGGSVSVNVLAWLDHSNMVLKPASIRVFSAGSCIVTGGVKVTNVHVRSKSHFDTVIEYTDAPLCDGDYSQTMGTTVVAVTDGTIVDLLIFFDYSGSSRTDESTSDPQVVVEITDSVPTVALWKDLETGTVLYRKLFDSASRRFVLVSEMGGPDASLGPQTPGKTWGNRCFAHIKDGRYSWALAACNKALESPDMSNNNFAGATYYNMGLIAQRTDDIGSAVRYFRKSLEVRPDNETVQNALAKIDSNDVRHVIPPKTPYVEKQQKKPFVEKQVVVAILAVVVALIVAFIIWKYAVAKPDNSPHPEEESMAESTADCMDVDRFMDEAESIPVLLDTLHLTTKLHQEIFDEADKCSDRAKAEVLSLYETLWPDKLFEHAAFLFSCRIDGLTSEMNKLRGVVDTLPPCGVSDYAVAFLRCLILKYEGDLHFIAAMKHKSASGDFDLSLHEGEILASHRRDQRKLARDQADEAIRAYEASNKTLPNSGAKNNIAKVREFLRNI